MSFWLILFAVLLAASLGGTFYLITRFHRFSFVEKMAEKHKALSWVVAALFVAVIVALSAFLINVWSAIVILLHLIFFWIIFDIILGYLRKNYKEERKHNIEGVLAIATTFVYLLFGWKFAHTVYRTQYNLQTAKDMGTDRLRICGFADSHLGITIDGEKFAEEMKRIEAENPDVVVLAGDFVDDDSCRADMVRACQAMGEMKSTYGVYYIDGNHDKGYYQSGRDFTYDELISELEKNGVTVLKDETVLVDDKFYIVGRKDKSDDERMAVSELVKDLDKSKYTLVLDHQPNDYANESEEDIDLVFSGHTHGGHLWPAGYIGVLLRANDAFYGAEEYNGTGFIVTSGISGWAIPFKTGTKSEYVVMDVYQAPQTDQ